jgi:hypothetical protein
MRTLALVFICTAFAAIGFFEAHKRNGDRLVPSVIGAMIGLCVWTFLAYYTNLFHR